MRNLSNHRWAQIRIVAILTTLIFILLLTTVTYPPTGYAFSPGPKGKIVSMVAPDGDFIPEDFEIYVINADGSNKTRLTENSTFDGYPTWSPNGKKIAFSRVLSPGEPDENWEIYIMNADGSNPTNITNTPDIDEFFPTWSPNGKKLAVTADKNGDFDFGAAVWNDVDIFVMNADGSGDKINLTDNNVEDYGAVWSPNGKKLAFATLRDGNYEIYVMDANGDNPTNLTNNDGHDGFWAPTWSPNGKKIAFPSNRDNPDLGFFASFEIYVMDANGDNPTRLTSNDVTDAAPIWSPNGQSLVFRSDRDNDLELYVMDTDGSNQDRLTSGIELWLIYDWTSGNIHDD